jgi:hypothetical protein
VAVTFFATKVECHKKKEEWEWCNN